MTINIIELINVFIDKYSTEIIGGLSVAILLFSFQKLLNFLKDFDIRRKYSGYIGEYTLYNFTSSGIVGITNTKLSIQPKWGKLVIYANNENIYQYIGEMTVTERNLYINCDGVSHLEKLQLVFSLVPIRPRWDTHTKILILWCNKLTRSQSEIGNA